MVATISFFTLIFLLSSHPLILSFLLIIFSITYGLTMAMASSSTWMRYMLIMVFLRGIIIIILYMTSLSSNENITIKLKNIIIGFFLILVSVSFIIFKEEIKIKTPLTTHPMFFSQDSFELIYKAYNTITRDLTLLTITYLLVVLIVAVKIISIRKGPLKINK